MSTRFLQVALLFYIGALVPHLTYVLSDECGFAFFPGRTDLFVGIIFLLIGFELWVYFRFGVKKMARSTGIWLLIARMIIIEAALSLDCSGFAAVLYLLLPFLAYFFLGRWAAMVIAGLYFGWFVTYFNLFRCPPCSFDEYVGQMLLFGLAFLWSVVMAGLVRAAEESRVQAQRLLVELEQSQQQLKAYADHAWELATAEERNRLARDIHDSIGHFLAGVNIQLEKALAFHQRDPAASEQAMHEAKRAAREALLDVRQSVRALRHNSELFSLAEALTELVDRWRSDRMKIELTIEGDEEGYTKPTLLALYRVAQEGLTNVHKHAQANHVQIWLNMDSENAKLRLSDNGIGFGQAKVGRDLTDRSHHYGLQGIRERLAFLGGQLEMGSGSGTGAALIVTIPKTPTTWPTTMEGLK